MPEPESKIAKSKKVLGYAEGAVNMGLFTAFTFKDAIAFITQGVGQFLFFPVMVGLTLIQTILTLFDLNKQRNANLGKIIPFILDVLITILLVIAVVGSLVAAAIFGAVTPIIFTVALAVKTLFNIFAAIFHGIAALFSKNAETRAHHKAQFFKHGIGALIGAVMTIGIGLLLILKLPAAAILCAVVSGVGLITGIVMGIVNYVKSKKTPIKTENKKTEAPPKIVVETQSNEPTLNKDKDYYYIKDRTAILKTKKDDEDKLSFLNEEISKKISELSSTLEKNKKKFFDPERSKLTAKVKVLKSLSKILNSHFLYPQKLKMFNNLLNESDSGIFQSFFKRKGDVEDIFDAAQNYLEDQIELEKPPQMTPPTLPEP